MTDREALQFVFGKLSAAADKITEGIAHKVYNNEVAALLDILPLVKDALFFLYDFLSDDEIEAAITESEAME